MLGLNYYNSRLNGLRDLGTNNLSSSLLNPLGASALLGNNNDYYSLLSGTSGLDSFTNPYGNILDPMKKDGQVLSILA
jgi:hypothetical protein